MTANTWSRGDSSGLFTNTHTQSDADMRRFSGCIKLDYLSAEHEERMLAGYFPKLSPTEISKYV